MCSHCATTKPFDKEKTLEYIENNFKTVYLSNDEMDEAIESLGWFTNLAKVLHIFGEWISGMTDKENRAEAKLKILEGWNAFKKESSEHKGSIGKFFLYLLGGVLAISGAGYLISLVFDVSPLIFWAIIAGILGFLIIIGMGTFSVMSYNLYKEIFKQKREALRENYVYGRDIGDEVKKRLMQFTNVFREKYSDSDELEELKEKYFALGEENRKLFDKNMISQAINLKIFLLIIVFLSFLSLSLSSIKETSGDGGMLIMVGIYALIALLTTRSIWSLHYIANKYFWEMRNKFNCLFVSIILGIF